MSNTNGEILYQKFIFDLLSDSTSLSAFFKYSSIQNIEKRKSKYIDTVRKFYKTFLLKYNQFEIDKFARIDPIKRFIMLTNSLSNNLFLMDLLSSDNNLYAIITGYFDILINCDIKSVSNVVESNCILDPSGNPISDINNIRIDVSEVNDWMLNELKKNPTDLYQLSSRRFEELIAEILIRKGYNVDLTPATRDGGKDIYVAQKDDLGSFLYIVECKQYKPTHKVGVNVLRDLYGVLSKERATYGIAVTTSYFSKPAQEFQQELQFQMSLQDFNSIKQWLCDVT